MQILSKLGHILLNSAEHEVIDLPNFMAYRGRDLSNDITDEQCQIIKTSPLVVPLTPAINWSPL